LRMGVSEDSYGDQLRWYLQEARKDAEFAGGVMFALSGYNPWGPFLMTPGLMDRIAAINALPDVAIVQPPVVTPPKEKPMDNKLRDALAAEFGDAFADLRATLPKHATVRYPRRQESAIKRLVLHHTTGAPTLTWEWMANYHVNTRQYAGVAYHIGIDQHGKVSYLTDITEASWHCGTKTTPEDDNADTLAISALGDYDTNAPSEAMRDAIARVVQVLDDYFRAMLPFIGHKDIAGDTACPGRHLYPYLAKFREDENMEEQDLRSLAWAARGISYNPDAALYKYAKANDLGGPVTNEFEAGENIAQGFERGIVYCARGDWGNVTHASWL
jgi:hypothetical protein